MNCLDAEGMQIKIVKIGVPSGCTWFNFFLSDSFTLFIHYKSIQHDASIAEIGIDRYSLIESGFSVNGRVLFRSSPGIDRGDISTERHIELMKIIKEKIRSVQ